MTTQGDFSNINWLDLDAFTSDREEPIGYFPHNRPIKDHIRFGMINLDKPAGPTSHDVVATVKKILEIKKAGHAGTLDPDVTGILPIGLLNATKILHTLHLLPKVYVCNMAKHSKIHAINWEQLFQDFTGVIYQYPPLESNVKRRLRKRTIYRLNFLEETDSEVLFEVECEAGTYIRTLCEDLGRASGVGAHMKELRRTRTGVFTEETRKTLNELFDAYMDWKEFGDETKLRSTIVPLEEGIVHLKEIIVKNNAVWSVSHGADLGAKGILGHSHKITKGETVAAKTAKGELIGLGEALVNFEGLNETIEHAFSISKVVIDSSIYKPD